MIITITITITINNDKTNININTTVTLRSNNTCSSSILESSTPVLQEKTKMSTLNCNNTMTSIKLSRFGQHCDAYADDVNLITIVLCLGSKKTVCYY